MGKVEKHPPSRTSPKNISNNSAISSGIITQINEHSLKRNDTESTHNQLVNSIEDTTVMNNTDVTWQTVHRVRSKKFKRTTQNDSSGSKTFFDIPIPKKSSYDHVHSYFSHDDRNVRVNPNFNRPKFDRMPTTQQISNKAESMKPSAGSKRRVTFSPFKLEFENRQMPAEILVLNDLVKHDNHLNVTTARYSIHQQTRHILLLFANDSSSYESLFQPSSWPNRLCGLSFIVKSPIRTPTSYSVLVHRVPREWNVDSMQPLIAQRYPSVVQVARIFHDRQPINRIRVDFQSNDDVQMILQSEHIFIDSLRYPAVPYKPLTRIARCFRCQQFGHKAVNCNHESKCFKCGEAHDYNRNCTNPIKCANCSASHMAGSPECPVKISFRREQRQQIENTLSQRRPPDPSFLSSPSRLYSSVLQTTASPITSPTSRNKTDSPSIPIGHHSNFIVDTIKDEIIRSQEILLNRIVQLSEKYDSVHEQQRNLTSTLETRIGPFLSTISEVLVNVCDQLKKSKTFSFTDEHHNILRRLRSPPVVSFPSNSYHSNNSTQASNALCQPIRPSDSPSSFNFFSAQ